MSIWLDPKPWHPDKDQVRADRALGEPQNPVERAILLHLLCDSINRDLKSLVLVRGVLLRLSQANSAVGPERANSTKLKLNKKQLDLGFRANNKYTYCGGRPIQ